MKTPNRIHANSTTKTASSHGGTIESKDWNAVAELQRRALVLLEPELQEVAHDWPAGKRRDVAEKLERWSSQLRMSASIMDSKIVIPNVN